jgi:hypothetical protein
MDGYEAAASARLMDTYKLFRPVDLDEVEVVCIERREADATQRDRIRSVIRNHRVGANLRRLSLDRVKVREQ